MNRLLILVLNGVALLHIVRAQGSITAWSAGAGGGGGGGVPINLQAVTGKTTGLRVVKESVKTPVVDEVTKHRKFTWQTSEASKEWRKTDTIQRHGVYRDRNKHVKMPLLRKPINIQDITRPRKIQKSKSIKYTFVNKPLEFKLFQQSALNRDSHRRERRPWNIKHRKTLKPVTVRSRNKRRQIKNINIAYEGDFKQQGTLSDTNSVTTTQALRKPVTLRDITRPVYRKSKSSTHYGDTNKRQQPHAFRQVSLDHTSRKSLQNPSIVSSYVTKQTGHLIVKPTSTLGKEHEVISNNVNNSLQPARFRRPNAPNEPVVISDNDRKRLIENINLSRDFDPSNTLLNQHIAYRHHINRPEYTKALNQPITNLDVDGLAKNPSLVGSMKPMSVPRSVQYKVTSDNLRHRFDIKPANTKQENVLPTRGIAAPDTPSNGRVYKPFLDSMKSKRLPIFILPYSRTTRPRMRKKLRVDARKLPRPVKITIDKDTISATNRSTQIAPTASITQTQLSTTPASTTSATLSKRKAISAYDIWEYLFEVIKHKFDLSTRSPLRTTKLSSGMYTRSHTTYTTASATITSDIHSTKHLTIPRTPAMPTTMGSKTNEPISSLTLTTETPLLTNSITVTSPLTTALLSTTSKTLMTTSTRQTDVTTGTHTNKPTPPTIMPDSTTIMSGHTVGHKSIQNTLPTVPKYSSTVLSSTEAYTTMSAMLRTDTSNTSVKTTIANLIPNTTIATRLSTTVIPVAINMKRLQSMRAGATRPSTTVSPFRINMEALQSVRVVTVKPSTIGTTDTLKPISTTIKAPKTTKVSEVITNTTQLPNNTLSPELRKEHLVYHSRAMVPESKPHHNVSTTLVAQEIVNAKQFLKTMPPPVDNITNVTENNAYSMKSILLEATTILQTHMSTNTSTTTSSSTTTPTPTSTRYQLSKLDWDYLLQQIHARFGFDTKPSTTPTHAPITDTTNQRKTSTEPTTSLHNVSSSTTKTSVTLEKTVTNWPTTIQHTTPKPMETTTTEVVVKHEAPDPPTAQDWQDLFNVLSETTGIEVMPNYNSAQKPDTTVRLAKRSQHATQQMEEEPYHSEQASANDWKDLLNALESLAAVSTSSNAAVTPTAAAASTASSTASSESPLVTSAADKPPPPVFPVATHDLPTKPTYVAVDGSSLPAEKPTQQVVMATFNMGSSAFPSTSGSTSSSPEPTTGAAVITKPASTTITDAKPTDHGVPSTPTRSTTGVHTQPLPPSPTTAARTPTSSSKTTTKSSSMTSTSSKSSTVVKTSTTAMAGAFGPADFTEMQVNMAIANINAAATPIAATQAASAVFHPRLDTPDNAVTALEEKIRQLQTPTTWNRRWLPPLPVNFDAELYIMSAYYGTPMPPFPALGIGRGGVMGGLGAAANVGAPIRGRGAANIRSGAGRTRIRSGPRPGRRVSPASAATGRGNRAHAPSAHSWTPAATSMPGWRNPFELLLRMFRVNQNSQGSIW